MAPIADSDAELVDLVRRLAADAGRAEAGGDGGEERRWDRASPILNLQLPDGSRLHAVLAVTKRPATLDPPAWLPQGHPGRSAAVGHPQPGARGVSGGGGAGPVEHPHRRADRGGQDHAAARAGLGDRSRSERIVTIEDTYELALEADGTPMARSCRCRPATPTSKARARSRMTELFRTGLRMSPDRVIVGEVRGHEVIPMLNAM